jgi:serine protease Do
MFLGKREMPEPVGRGFLGIEIKEGKDTVEVSAVLAGSPAAKAGVKTGDQITQIKGKAVKTHADMQKRTAELKPGDSVTLTVVRSGEDHEITIKAGEGL